MRLAVEWVTLSLTLALTVLASIEESAIKPRDVLMSTPTDSGLLLPSLEPRMNAIEDSLEPQERKLPADPYTVPYQDQTGPTRYAPLAKKPGTAVVTSAPTPQFPPSPYKIATAYMKAPTVLTTLTASETRFVTMMENTAVPAPHP
ncbi:putative beta-1,6-glucan biosynthesis protein (Knh1) [Aspergillus stella-maris]|uniref:putative beta-1,6-glucan biosynthesis protein (Knh1) n=1 Tax=Aspergillus stella-maris TaxID=1810926 RepID=UPI003CCCF192